MLMVYRVKASLLTMIVNKRSDIHNPTFRQQLATQKDATVSSQVMGTQVIQQSVCVQTVNCVHLFVTNILYRLSTSLLICESYY